MLIHKMEQCDNGFRIDSDRRTAITN